MLETKAPQRAQNQALHAMGTNLFFEIYIMKYPAKRPQPIHFHRTKLELGLWQ